MGLSRLQACHQPTHRPYRAGYPPWRKFADRSSYSVGDSEAEADADGDADSDVEADAEGDADLEAEAEADGSTELEAAGTDGKGTGVGSGMNRDGMARIESTMMSTKMPMMMNIHGRARRSCRVGSEPR